MREHNYINPASELTRLLGVISSESDKANVKIIAHGNRLGNIDVHRSAQDAAAFESVMGESAADFEIYAKALEGTLAGFEHNIPLLTEGYTEHVKTLDLETTEGRNELEAMRGKLQELVETFKSVQGKVIAIRDVVHSLHNSATDPRLKRATFKLLEVVKKLSSVYEEFETFALRLLYAVDSKKA